MSHLKYHTVYQITNLINQKIYVGCHSTNNLNDDYMGSGNQIIMAINKYGVDNFKKEILFIFDNKDDMSSKEREIVDEEFINRPNVYNITIGGLSSGFLGGKHTEESKINMRGKVRAIDLNGNTFKVSTNDHRIISGELQVFSKGMATVKDNHGNTFRVSVDDPRLLTGELVGIRKGCAISDEQRMVIKECSSNRTQTEETKKKISDANRGKKRTEEQNKANSEAQKGKIAPDHVRKKIKLSNTGKVNTIEHNQKIGMGNKGKKRTPEQINKMKEAWVLRKQKKLNLEFNIE